MEKMRINKLEQKIAKLEEKEKQKGKINQK
jgi:hypothetical protein